MIIEAWCFVICRLLTYFKIPKNDEQIQFKRASYS